MNRLEFLASLVLGPKTVKDVASKLRVPTTEIAKDIDKRTASFCNVIYKGKTYVFQVISSEIHFSRNIIESRDNENTFLEIPGSYIENRIDMAVIETRQVKEFLSDNDMKIDKYSIRTLDITVMDAREYEFEGYLSGFGKGEKHFDITFQICSDISRTAWEFWIKNSFPNHN